MNSLFATMTIFTLFFCSCNPGGQRSEWLRISLSDRGTCGIYGAPLGGKLYCTGSNFNQEIAPHKPDNNQPTNQTIFSFVEVEPPMPGILWRDVVVAEGFNCAVTTKNELYCLGRNFSTFGKFEWARIQLSSSQRQIKTMRSAGSAIFVTVEGGETYALWSTQGSRKLDGNWITLSGYLYQHDGTRPSEAPRCNIAHDPEFSYCQCGLQDNGKMRCGSDMQTIESGASIEDEWRDVSMGIKFACAVGRVRGRICCFGTNDEGQLGDGSRNLSMEPVFLSGPVGDLNWQQVATGWDHACALTNDPTYQGMWCWGDSNMGQLGQGNNNDSPLPVVVSVANQKEWRQIAVAGQTTCAISATGQLYCWGRGTTGSLGIGPIENLSRSSCKRLYEGQQHWFCDAPQLIEVK